MIRANRITLSCLLIIGLFTASAALGADGTWKRLGPAPRCWGPQAVFDPLRNRMIAFGGSPLGGLIANSYDVAWSLNLTGTPGWTSLTNPGTGPFGRESFSSIYDPVRDRFLLFGGQGGNTYGDVWSLSLSGTPAWTNITPGVGTSPVPRRGHTAIYDPVRDRMIVFGGNDASSIDHNDVWALSLSGTPAWTQLTPVGTPPAIRSWHTAIYDPVRDRMVVFAGWVAATNGSLGDAWSLSLSGTPTWSSIAASGSVLARNSHTAIYDPVGDRMVVNGGYNYPGIPNPAVLSILSFAGSPAWSEITPAGTPPPQRDGHAAVYDAPNQRIVYYGGSDPEFSNVWTASLSGSPAWGTLAPVGASNAIQGPVIYDGLRDRLVLLGTGISNDIYAQSLASESWSRTVPVGDAPQGNAHLAAIYDSGRDRAVAFVSGTVDPPELWSFAFATSMWTKLAPVGTPPTNRTGVSVVFDAVRDRMLVFGGAVGGGTFADETWVINFGATTTWGEMPAGGTRPAGRDGHLGIFDTGRDDMVIFGGHDGFGTLRRDVWKLDMSTQLWTEILPAVSLPSDRTVVAGIYDPPRNRLLFFGGNDPLNGPRNDLWALPLTGTPVWAQLAPAGLIPMERGQARAIYDPVRDRMVVYGGLQAGFPFDDTWALSPTVNVGVPSLQVPGNAGLALAAPRPNPSRDLASFAFTLARPGHTTLEVFDMSGRRVRTLMGSHLPAGSHSASWRGEDDRGAPLADGLYFVRLRSGGEQVTRRVVRVM